MAILMGAGAALPQTKDLGIFTDQGSVGQTPPGSKALYDPAKGEYRITGGGANIWNAADAFYFVWKKASGDVSLTADVQWVGTSTVGHRKAVLMVRQGLDPGSAYADAVSHGDGLTSLQFRGVANEQTYQVFTNIDGPARLRIVRQGSRYTMYAGKPNEELKPVGPVEYVTLKDPVYVGLGVCSHVATTLETAIFSNVKLEQEATAERPRIVGIANIAVKVDNLDEARKFYANVLGMAEAFHTKDRDVPGDLACFKVNDHQYVEVSPTLQSESEDRLIRIGFETTDAQKLRDYLAKKGIQAPAAVDQDLNGNRSFTVKDPDGHTVEFVQYMGGSIHSRNFGKYMPDTRISDHLLHVGVRVTDPAKADGFYKDILGFRLQWKGGRTDDRVEWISLMVPDGYDWLEYMVGQTTPTPQQLGVLHHYALSTLDIQKVYKMVIERGYKPPQEPAIARDGRWLLQLYDKNYTRTEMMIRKPVRTPCCSPNLDDYKQ
jgi:lactoylglutathione lyase